MRSEPLRWIYTPLTISSSVRRAQSSASRLVRKVLVLVGQPVLRTRAFQVPASVLTIVAIFPCSQSVPLYRHCTEFVPLDYRTGLDVFLADMKKPRSARL